MKMAASGPSVDQKPEPNAPASADSSQSGKNSLLAIVDDLYFSSRIEAAARHAGWEITLVGAGLSTSAVGIPPGQPSGQVQLDPEKIEMIEAQIAGRPSLVIIDLNQPCAVSAITIIRALPAGKEIPLVAFGSHKDFELMQSARRAGADRVLARSRFVEILPELFGGSDPVLPGR
jgi:CheY-like chemotaxis protein